MHWTKFDAVANRIFNIILKQAFKWHHLFCIQDKFLYFCFQFKFDVATNIFSSKSGYATFESVHVCDFWPIMFNKCHSQAD